MPCYKIKDGFICINPPLDKIDKIPADGECAKYHYKLPELGYLQWHADADARHKRGEKQFECPMCGLFIWEIYRIGKGKR